MYHEERYFKCDRCGTRGKPTCSELGMLTTIPSDWSFREGKHYCRECERNIVVAIEAASRPIDE